MTIQRHSVGTAVGPLGRAWLLGTALALLTGFGFALWLKPDPRGFGTHQQLGLPPCTFRLLFGLPCPGCGMTTSFSHFSRGEFHQAAQANLAGVVLAAISALMIPWCLFSAHAGRMWLVSNPLEVTGAGTALLGGLAMLFWIMRISGVN